MPIRSRFERCAWTVEEEANPTALPMSRTVGGYPYLAEYLPMKSKISCWRFVRSMAGRPPVRLDVGRQRTCVRTVAGVVDGCKARAAVAAALCGRGCARAADAPRGG